MHFEVHVEDRSGKDMLELLLPRLLSPQDTYRVHPYRGIGKLPDGLKSDPDPKKRILLNQLPRILRGHGETFAGYGSEYQACVIVVCDLDSRCRHDFRLELISLLDNISPRPSLTYFCIAEEEGEAWLLGDRAAVISAFPHTKQTILNAYVPDSICGTWETLADAVYPKGARALQAKAYYEIGAAKCDWAQKITPLLNIDANDSPSFCYFRNKVRNLSDVSR